MREIRTLRSMRRGLETRHGRDHVTLANRKREQQGTQTSTYTGAPDPDPTRMTMHPTTERARPPKSVKVRGYFAPPRRAANGWPIASRAGRPTIVEIGGSTSVPSTTPRSIRPLATSIAEINVRDYENRQMLLARPHWIRHIAWSFPLSRCSDFRSHFFIDYYDFLRALPAYDDFH